MEKLTSFNDRTEMLISFQNFNSSFNNDNTTKYKRTINILKMIIEKELTFKQKRCLELYYKRNLSTVKISKILGIYPSTVWRHIEKAKQKIKNIAKYI